MSHREQDFEKKLRDLGYRITPQRQLILDTLCDFGGHATINQIYEQVHTQAPAIDKATIYRSVQLFHKHNLLFSAKINGQTVYEIAQPQPHHHLLCNKCGHEDALANHHFEALTTHLLQEHGFEAKLNHLTIKGICANCREIETG